ncbi:MAG: Thermitase [Bacteroidetes bacterium]|jgi:subtilisin family serine protease|nr:Thermitase [Bacteroidota bacterium]
MKRKITLVLAAVFISVFAFAQSIHPHYADGKIYIRVKTTTIVQVGKGANWNNLPIASFPFLKQLASAYGISKVSKPFYAAKDDKDLQRTYVVCFTNRASVSGLIAALEQSGAVDFAERVPLMKTSYVPNDPAYNGGTSGTNNWHLVKIGAGAAWDVFHGASNITVAVVDNAIQTNHPDLSANIYVNAGEIASNGIDDDNNGFIDDVSGYDVANDDANPNPPTNSYSHGTHCAGLVGARNDNSTGISSIGFNVRVIPVKCTTDTSSPTAVDAGYAGIVYAVNSKARVISCSWGGDGSSATDQSVINYAWNHNCIVVAAAGNNGSTVQNYPGAYNNVYCVASTTTTDGRSGFSNYGTWVDIAAPGSNIYSCIPNLALTGGTSSYYTLQSGTSMATPIVAGLCGLMLSKSPYLTPSQVLTCISTTATTITPTGMGAGRINALAAMNCAASATPPAPIVDFSANKTLTCPGTPVQFTDLTYYAPTGWSWTFTGGTPSTSTSQNPSVTYAAAGTYQVVLTANNVNGSGTKTKTSYITVSGPTTLPLIEGFTATTFPPAGWSEYDLFGDSVKWQRNPSFGGFAATGKCMWFDNYTADLHGKSDLAITPKYDFSNLASATMTFDVAYARYDADYSDSLAVLVSTDCGLSYTQVYLRGGSGLATAPDYTNDVFEPTAAEWRTETINLNSYAGSGNVLVAFKNIGRYGQAIYVDNVNISGIVAGAPPTALFAASANSCTGQTMTLTDQSTNNPTSWSWTSSGGNLSSSTDQNPSITFNTGGTYTVTLTATNAFGNSTPVSQIFTINQTPTAVAVNTGPFCAQGTVTLSGSGGGTYSWAGPGSYSSALQNPTRTPATLGMSGTYTLTVTNNGCSASSTTSVTVNFRPVATVTGSSSFCANDSLTLSASTSTGGGPNTITGYQWQLGGAPISGAASVTYNATQAGVYSVIVTNSANCSTTSGNKTLTVNALPNVAASSSPGDTICSGDAVTLTATGAPALVWDNGVTNGVAFTPAGTATYIVEGTDANNCTNSDSITVVVNGCVGLKGIDQQEGISVYPNPSNGNFEIHITGPSGIISLKIVNSIGQVIYQQNLNGSENRVAVKGFSSGIYFVVLQETNGTNMTKKIIVE